MTCECEAVLRRDAEQLLEHADLMRAKYPKAAQVSERHAMSLALAAGHLRDHERKTA